MQSFRPKMTATLVVTMLPLLLASCGEDVFDGTDSARVEVSSSALTAQDRLNTCAQDPRVVAGLVTKEICAGADVFFRETFNGNGRTCGTCHSMENNTTLDPQAVAALRKSKPNDPLFVFERTSALTELDNTDALDSFAGIRENVDGFEDPTHKFVSRSVPHLLSMKTSIARDTGDGSTNPPVERTGWSGDGAPGDGSLRSFLTGAVTQHYTKDLRRRAGTDFRVPTAQELDLVLAFQLALGRQNELALNQVNLFDADANKGRQAFLNPQGGQCFGCHLNGGANALQTGKNRNFDTGTRQLLSIEIPIYKGLFFGDAGFGGKGLATPTTDVNLFDETKGFGNNTFNTPPLIEAADTGPFFHNNQSGNIFDRYAGIEDAVNFYTDTDFGGSPGRVEMQARFGVSLNLDEDDVTNIGRFLRALNAALNLDMAKQRLQAALTLAARFPTTRVDIQQGLLRLADLELNDAKGVMTTLPTETAQGHPITRPALYPVSVDRIKLAKTEIAAARSASASTRAGHISNAVSRVQNARDQIGANITFQLGQGNLMF